MSTPSSFWHRFGPGLLFAGAAIGVSHLVQSTRAGALAGFGLAGIVVLALIFKYPFFEFGPRFAAATGTSLIEGYRAIGRWAVWLYLLLTGTTGIIVQVAVTVFTAYLVRYAVGGRGALWLLSAGLVAGSMVLLRAGRFRLLDRFIKAVMVLLTLTTLLAALKVAPLVDWSTVRFLPVADGELLTSLAFIVALVGWMPTAIDLNVWSSLWTLAKDDSAGGTTTVRQARTDFDIGYLGTGALAFAFLVLGAAVMHSSGQSFDPRGTVFATQLIELYTASLGAWIKPVVLTAALTTMVSTTLTVVDGVPRAIDRALMVLSDSTEESAVERSGATGRFYWPVMLGVALATVLVIGFIPASLTAMVDVATTISFLIAPVLGWLTLKAVTGDRMPAEHRPGKLLTGWCWLGIVLLGLTALLYLGRFAGLSLDR